MEANVKFATADDIDRLINARFDYFKADNQKLTSEQHSVIESNLRQYFKKHINTDFFAAFIEENGAIISLAFLAISEEPANLSFPTGKTGTIFNVLTYPEYRRKGFATMVMHALIEEGKRQNLSYIELSATESGKPVYEKLGFLVKDPSSHTDMKLSLL